MDMFVPMNKPTTCGSSTRWWWIAGCCLTLATQAQNDAGTTLRIGQLDWMPRNLDVVTFRNGDSIPEARTTEAWNRAAAEGRPAWCYLDTNPGNAWFGRMYNWYAVSDPRGLAPAGWRIATPQDWESLQAAVAGGAHFDPNELNMSDGQGWRQYWSEDPNVFRPSDDENGTFMHNGIYWWTPAADYADLPKDKNLAIGVELSEYEGYQFMVGIKYRGYGFYARCVKE